jgi:hypothetical protein
VLQDINKLTNLDNPYLRSQKYRKAANRAAKGKNACHDAG